MLWFWNFFVYSFLGYLLEEVFSLAIRRPGDRKCLVVLPLCPVYGLGACAILLLPEAVDASPPLLFLLGGLAATAAEYLTAVFYEKVLGVAFWDYRGLPGSVDGRVCLPFSLAWGALAVALARWVHPALEPFLSTIPAPVTWAAAAALGADLALSAFLLKRTGDKTCLQWYS